VCTDSTEISEIGYKTMTEETSRDKRNRGGSKKRSFVWDHFTFKDGLVYCKVIVNNKMCNTALQYSTGKSNNTTSTMRYHLKQCHQIEGKLSLNENSVPINQENFDGIFLKWFVSHHLPFSMLDGNFKEIVSFLRQNSAIKEPNKNNLKILVKNSVKNKQEELKFRLKNKFFTIVIDGWTSKGHNHYIGIGIHYFYKDNLCKNLLALKYFGERQFSENLAKLVELTLRDYDLSEIYMLAYISDGAANMKKTGILLESNEKLVCIAHTLHLTIEKGLSSFPLIKKIKKLVSHFNNSEIAKRSLFQNQELLNKKKRILVSFSKTRWGSIFLVINRLLEEQLSLISYFNSSDSVHKLSDMEWDTVKEISLLLKPFCQWIEFFEGDTYVTISAVLPVISILNKKYSESAKNFLDFINLEKFSNSKLIKFKRELFRQALFLMERNV